jgi:hypothetical protein
MESVNLTDRLGQNGVEMKVEKKGQRVVGTGLGRLFERP